MNILCFQIDLRVVHELREYRSFRQRVSSPTTCSPMNEVDSPTSNVSSPTLICQLLREPTSEILFSFGSAVDERTRNKL